MSNVRKTIARSLFVFAALFILSASRGMPNAMAGPEVTCAWCVQISDLVGNATHAFPNPTDLCGSTQPPIPGGTGEIICARCGGTSLCHTTYDPGECHLACGGTELALL